MSHKIVCAFLNCGNSSTKDRPYQFFTFPSFGLPGSPGELRCLQWMERSCNPTILEMTAVKVYRAKKRVCKDHFNANQFIDDNQKRLKQEQVPNWNVIHGTEADKCHAVVDDPAVVAEAMVVSPVHQKPVHVVDPQLQGDVPEQPAQPEPTTPRTSKRVSAGAILRESGLRKADMTPKKKRMLQTSRKYHSKLVRLGKKLARMKGDVKKMQFFLDNDRIWDQVGDHLSPGLRLLVGSERANFRKRPSARRFDEDVQAFYWQ